MSFQGLVSISKLLGFHTNAVKLGNVLFLAQGVADATHAADIPSSSCSPGGRRGPPDPCPSPPVR